LSLERAEPSGKRSVCRLAYYSSAFPVEVTLNDVRIDASCTAREESSTRVRCHQKRPQRKGRRDKYFTEIYTDLEWIDQAQSELTD
jgi:hypothetical protein